jgi:hypothetical protein
LELEEGVDTVDDHGDEAEEGGGSERLNGVLVAGKYQKKNFRC